MSIHHSGITHPNNFSGSGFASPSRISLPSLHQPPMALCSPVSVVVINLSSRTDTGSKGHTTPWSMTFTVCSKRKKEDKRPRHTIGRGLEIVLQAAKINCRNRETTPYISSLSYICSCRFMPLLKPIPNVRIS